MHANDITREAKGLRQLKGLLAQCGLPAWQPVLTDLIAHYRGLDALVELEAHAPLASLLHLLRAMAQVSARPDNEGFASLVADLEFLNYRVRRSTEASRSCFEHGLSWDPAQTDLASFAAGHPLGAWRGAMSAEARRRFTNELLRQLRHRHEHGD